MDSTIAAPKRTPAVVVFILATAVLYGVKSAINALPHTHHLFIDPWAAWVLICGFVVGISMRGFAHLSEHARYVFAAIGARASHIDSDVNHPDESGPTIYFAMICTVALIALAIFAAYVSPHMKSVLAVSIILAALGSAIWGKVRNPDRLAAKLTMKDGQPVADLTGSLNLRLTPAQQREVDAYNERITGQYHTLTEECRP